MNAPWAKVRRDCRDGRGEWCRARCCCPEIARLSIVGHSADVAAVMRSLLDIPTIARRLAQLLMTAELTREDRLFLVALTALHDVGKVNVGFQHGPFADAGPGRAGHIAPLLSLFEGRDVASEAALRRLQAAGLDRLRHLTHWKKLSHRTDTTRAPFEAVLAHHGSLPPGQRTDPALWRERDGYDPAQACGELIEAIAIWLPDAFVARPIAWSDRFGHAFAGLVTLADWLGSDVDIFPFGEAAPDGVARFAWACARADARVRRLWLLPDATRAVATDLAWQSGLLTGHDTPSFAQRAMLSLPPPQAGRLCLIEDETGSGKTEAALIHFLDLFRRGEVDGMYLALPTRAAARQIHQRIEAALQRLIGPEARVTLAVPGYITRDAASEGLPDAAVLHPDDARDQQRDTRWAGERPKRYLASWVAVGTIDQVLLGGLRVRHAQLRSGAMLRLLLVVDEVHSSDIHMTAILRNLLDQHVRAGGHALLMSATLGASSRARFFEREVRPRVPPYADAVATPYPAVWTAGDAPLPDRTCPDRARKTARMQLNAGWADPVHVAALAAAAARKGARVLVIRNTVRLVIETQRALEQQAPELSFRVALPDGATVACPHHARFAAEDRLLLDASLEALLGRKAPRDRGSVTIASQTAEQSLDIDADLLVTDLCPADVLLQRIGRLHRHPKTARPDGFAEPVAIVLAPDEETLAACIGSSGQVRRGPLALGAVYPDLLGVLATRRRLVANPTLQIPLDNRPLVEAATHEGALEALADELGGCWAAHWQMLRGTARAGVQAASRITIDFCKPIEPLNEEQVVATRIGLSDRVVSLPAGTIGPFGRPITTLSLRADWLHHVPDTAEPVVEPGPGLTIRLGDRRFVYDRHGLQPSAVS